MDEGLDLKPPHFKILAYIMEKGRATNEEIKEVVKNPNIAVKCRQDLLKWGLIHGVKEKVGGRIVDVFYPVASSWTLMYVYDVLRLFERAFLKSKGWLLLKETCDVRVFEEGAPCIDDFKECIPSLKNLTESEFRELSEKSLLWEIFELEWEVHRCALLLREAILEFRKRVVLLSFPEDKRNVIFEYDDKLSEFLALCLHILYTRDPKRGDENKRLIDSVNKKIRRFSRKLKDPKVRKRLAFLIERWNMYALKRFGERLFENSVKAVVKLIKNETIIDRDTLLGAVKIYFERCEKMAQEEEKTKLHELYQYLTNNEEGINAYCEFLGRLLELPREIYIVPIGFKGYIRKFLQVIEEGAKIPEEGIGEKFKKSLEDFEKEIEYFLPPHRTYPPIFLQGIRE